MQENLNTLYDSTITVDKDGAIQSFNNVTKTNLSLQKDYTSPKYKSKIPIESMLIWNKINNSVVSEALQSKINPGLLWNKLQRLTFFVNCLAFK